MNMNVEAEIRDLKRRVSDIEASFGFLTQQLSGVHKDLLADQANTEQGFHQVDSRLDRIDARLDHLDQGLRAHMPKIVGEAVRDALSGRPRRKG
jgi:tetrahydromethanopterin S-methyltransferase subunit G